MKRRATVFERLALKEKVRIQRQMSSLVALNKEANRVSDVCNQLEDIVEEIKSKDDIESAGFLRANAEMGFHVRSQLDTAKNRQDYINEELANIRRKVAFSNRRLDRSTEKAKEIRASDREEREHKREDAEASRRQRTVR